MFEVVLYLFLRELEFVSDGRHRTGLAEHLLDLLADGHAPFIVIRARGVVAPRPVSLLPAAILRRASYHRRLKL